MPSVLGKIIKKFTEGKGQDLVGNITEFIGMETIRRKEWEILAYINTMYKQGHHWVNDMGVPDRRDPNQLRRHVNKFKSTLRSLKNAVTFNEPIIDIIPDKGQEVGQEELDLASAFIRTEFDEAGDQQQGMRDLLRTIVDDAANKSFSLVSVFPNNNEDNRMNDIQVHDSFDVFFDNHNLQKAQIMLISSYEDKAYLQQKGYQNIDQLPETSDHSHSALKNEFELMHGKDPNAISKRVLIDNVYYVQHEVNEDGTIKENSPTVWNVILAGDTIIKEPEQLKGYKSLGQLFFLYYMEKDKHVKYPTPWMTDVVPLQRSLNAASENIDTILHWFAKVRFLQRRGSSNSLQLIGDQHVQKIAYDGERPIPMEMPNPPAGLFEQVKMRELQIEDMVGMHSASMGKASGDRASGRREAILQAGDADNVAEPVRNLEALLSAIAAQILENASDNMNEVTRIHGIEGQEFEAIGQAAFKKLKKEKQENAVELIPFRNIRTVVVPGSNASLTQGRNEILELMPILVGEGNQEKIDALFDVLMRMYNTGMARDISKVIEQKAIELEVENPDIKIAEMEIEKMVRGEPVTATPEQPHELHIQLKMEAARAIEERFGQDSPILAIFAENITQHQALAEGAGEGTVANVIQGPQ